MEIIQTDAQGMVNRIYSLAGTVILPQLVVTVIVGSQETKETLWYLVILFLGFNVLLALWLFLFNSGNSRLDSFSIKINDQNICVSSFGREKKIKKDHFLGCKIHGIYPRKIKLLASDCDDISFSYYALNAKQRRDLFDILREENS